MWSLVSGPTTPPSSRFFQSHWLGLLRVLFCLPLVTSMSKCLGPCSFYPLLQFCHITLKATCILMTGMCISVALRGVLIICPAASPMVPLLCLIRVWNVLYRKDDSRPPWPLTIRCHSPQAPRQLLSPIFYILVKITSSYPADQIKSLGQESLSLMIPTKIFIDRLTWCQGFALK